MITGNILRINNSLFGDITIPRLSISKSECINISGTEEKFKDELLNCLLLKAQNSIGLELFGHNINQIEKKDRQSLRRKISYWPKDHEQIIDEKFLKLKQAMMGPGKGSNEQTAKLFLDHLMIGDSLTSQYKRLCYSLLMNAPELLIIDQALDLLEEELVRSLMKVFSRYSDKSGMAILNFSNSSFVLNLLKARRFNIVDSQLVEIMDD